MGRSRSSLLPRGSTPSGSVAPSWPPSPPSRRCGSPSRSTMSPAPASSTASASKLHSPPFIRHTRQNTRAYMITLIVCSPLFIDEPYIFIHTHICYNNEEDVLIHVDTLTRLNSICMIVIDIPVLVHTNGKR